MEPSYNVLITGGSGLVGKDLIAMASADDRVATIYSIVRRVQKNLPAAVEQIQPGDFSDLAALQMKLPGDLPIIAFCCLGTTIKKAGSRDAFVKVDRDYVLSFGKLCQSLRCQHLAVISAKGAKHDSMIFYNRVKGQMEQALTGLDLRALSIYRPSLLSGPRDEFRLGERPCQTSDGSPSP